jgi:hypothetical protein
VVFEAERVTLYLALRSCQPHACPPLSGLVGLARNRVLGIHNAWDAVAYHVFVNMRKAKD